MQYHRDGGATGTLPPLPPKSFHLAGSWNQLATFTANPFDLREYSSVMGRIPALTATVTQTLHAPLVSEDASFLPVRVPLIF
jgi:hypothetical protein